MERYFILWSQMSASSQRRDYLEARLHFVYSWMPTEDDSDPWLQVDFAITLDLLKLTIQGAPNGELFVKSFTVTYANSSGIFQNLTSGSILKVKINQQFHIIGYFVKKPRLGVILRKLQVYGFVCYRKHFVAITKHYSSTCIQICRVFDRPGVTEI